MIIRLIALLMCFAGPVLASQDRWPALYDVTGVASNDTLNVRSGPSGDAQVIGTLPADARNIEVVQPNDRGSWGRINLGEASGWVSLRYMARQPGQVPGMIPATIQCFGTEPFWGLDLRNGAVFEDPETMARSFEVTGARMSANRLDRWAITGTNGTANMVATISAQMCSDGMSDRAYGLTIDLVITRPDATQVYSGCCTLQP